MSEKQPDGTPPTLPPSHRLWLARLPRRFGVMAVATAALLPLAVGAALAVALLLLPVDPAAAQGGSPGTEPTNVQVVPGDGILTVSWTLTPRQGVADEDIRHALRWSQEAGVWDNPAGATTHQNDGVAVGPGVTSYTIRGLQNGLATGVFVRSYAGRSGSERSGSERSPFSSKWVRVKGEQTTPQGAEPTPTPPPPQESANCPEPAGGDYDSDDDRLIEVCSLAQLNAIRWDARGRGSASAAGYAAAFPNAAAGMGCPSRGCNGYELTADLDFDTNGNGEADAGDAYWNRGKGWTPITYGYSRRGDLEYPVFEGNTHTISNLYINSPLYSVGLFGCACIASIHNLGLESVDVTGRGALVGGLVGTNKGTISGSWVTGSVSGGSDSAGGLAGLNYSLVTDSHTAGEVSGAGRVGGLIGQNCMGVILDSYSTANVSATQQPKSYSAVGGLVGFNRVSIRGSYAGGDVSGGSAVTVGGLVGRSIPGEIVASYATGDVSGSATLLGGLVGWNASKITASYAVGSVSGLPAVGGLTGRTYGEWANRAAEIGATGAALASYWDTQTTGRSDSFYGTGKTTAELQTPTGYAGIYADWNVDIDGDGNADDPWDFGTSSQYPALKRLRLSEAQQRGARQDAPALPPPAPAGTFAVTAAATVAEGENTALTITLSEAAPVDGVAFTVTAGYDGGSTATSGDVGSIASLVTVAGGNSTLDIAIPTIDDAVDEDDETFTVTIAAATAGWEKAGDGQDTAIITITDDDTAGVSVTPATLSVIEGRSSAYTVVLDAEPTVEVVVRPASDGGGAVSFTPASRTFSTSNWNAPQTFTVSSVADADAADESVAIRHRVASNDVRYEGFTVPPVAVTVVDTTPTNFAVSSAASAAEGSDATLTVTLTATAPAGGAVFGVSAGYQSGAGKAEQAEVGDVPQTVTVAAGQTTATLTIPLATDALEEGDETFTVMLTPPSGWTVAAAGDAVATVTITDVAPPEEEAPAEAPGPVESLELSTTGGRITVAWQAPQSGGAPDTYLLNLKNADDGKDKHKTVQADQTSVTFRNLEAGATYQVWVRAVNAGGKGERVRASITLPEPPGPVVNLSVSGGTNEANSITVAWEAPASGGGVDNYVVRLTPAGGGKDRVKRPDADKTSVTFRNLEAGATYQVKVRGENEAGKGEPVRASIILPE